MLSLESFVSQLTHAPPAESVVQSSVTLPPLQDASRNFPPHFPVWLRTLLGSQDIERLTEWQWETLQLLQQGHHVCLATPAGSGRGIARLLAMYQSLGIDRRGHGLFIFPHKQRELAQLSTILIWNDQLAPEHRLGAEIYDGDTPSSQRRTIRLSVPQLLLTTPEMLHAGILAYHGGWRTLLQGLRYVVVVDVHMCVGALVTHLAHVLRRLHRLARHYGAQPQYLLTSSPLANPEPIAQALTGRSCMLVTGKTWRRQSQSHVLIETNRDLTTIGRALLERHRAAGLAVVVFEPQRTRLEHAQGAMPHKYSQSSFSELPIVTPEEPLTPESYHSAERRLLQDGGTAMVLPDHVPLTAVRPSAVRSVIFLGLPPSLLYLHDYLSLLANGCTPSMSILVLQGRTPLECYLLRHPDMYQKQWVQGLPLAFTNAHIVRQHLRCAAAELALKAGESYAGLPNLDDFIKERVSDQALTPRTASQQWITSQQRPHRGVNLRWYERPAALINRRDGRVLTRLSRARALRLCFEGGQYIHGHGGMFHVEQTDDDHHRIVVIPELSRLSTRGLFRTTVDEKRLASAIIKDPYRLTFGTLDYTESLQAVEHLELHSQARQRVEMVSGKERHIHTQGVWLDFHDNMLSARPQDPSALHVLVHAILSALPLVCHCEPEDIRGGVYSKEEAGRTRLGVRFVDAHRGGSGLSACLYELHEEVLNAALSLLLQCNCAHGCSQCVAEKRCDTCKGEERLDRQAGITLLQRILGRMSPSLEKLTSLPESARDHSARHLYLCLTTQKSAEDVGGWQHKHLLGLGLAMTYDSHDQSYRVYSAKTVEHLVTSLRRARLIIGFNTRDFDYQVLQPYTDAHLPTLATCAILDDVQQALGYRLNLKHLVHETLDFDRPDDSLETLSWYREGDTERLIQSCRRDIDLLRALIHHGGATGTLNYRDRSGTQKTLPVSWQQIKDDG